MCAKGALLCGWSGVSLLPAPPPPKPLLAVVAVAVPALDSPKAIFESLRIKWRSPTGRAPFPTKSSRSSGGPCVTNIQGGSCGGEEEVSDEEFCDEEEDDDDDAELKVAEAASSSLLQWRSQKAQSAWPCDAQCVKCESPPPCRYRGVHADPNTRSLRRRHPGAETTPQPTPPAPLTLPSPSSSSNFPPAFVPQPPGSLRLLLLLLGCASTTKLPLPVASLPSWWRHSLPTPQGSKHSPPIAAATSGAAGVS
mmetsp:Transcript_76795/g.154070  ORF Transcript_76795/g.154070 Transcript_76795/m.154070 type:complete len:252 (-) Transcript_76795:1001-1756(-)